MDHVHMSLKDYLYLRKLFINLDRYVLNVSMLDDEVIIDFYDEKFRSFLSDYRSLVIRRGTADKQSYNDIGIRLNLIFDTYIRPLLKEENEQ